MNGNSHAAILTQTRDSVEMLLENDLQQLTLERVVLGLFFTGVKLSNNSGGISFTPVKMIPEAVCCPSSARAMPDSGRLRGKDVTEVLEDLSSQNPLKKTIAIATLNALSETCRIRGFYKNYDFVVDADPLDFFSIPKDSYTIIVGALLPYIKMLKKNNYPYGILELDPRTLKPEEMPHYIPPEEASSELPKADYLLITGTTLINDSLDGILEKRKESATTVVVGPTASLYPEAFFKRGIEYLGGITVTNADGMLDIISEAGSGYHFYGKYAEKTVIKKPQAAIGF
jgi:uncharacterized protein (DUF4213/DUF364 family)